MKALRKTGPMNLKRTLLKGLLAERRILPSLAIAAGLLFEDRAVGNEINLVTRSSGAFVRGTAPPSASDGGVPNAGYTTIDALPAGAGEPFLTGRNLVIEQGMGPSRDGEGQGYSYVPFELFENPGANDFVNFRTINDVPDATLEGAPTVGFEEWNGFVAMPDGSSALLLLGAVLVPLGLMRARRKTSRNT